MSKGRVEEVYVALRQMCVNFRLRPGERVNEVALAGQLGTSRTPLREALNRLAAEGFIDFEPGRGFICRKLSVREVHDLYEMRIALEGYVVRLVVKNAPDSELQSIAEFLDRTGGGEPGGWTLEEVVAFDERFHNTLAALAGNQELCATLKNINARIRFFRWVNMEERRARTQHEHREILTAIIARDVVKACELMEHHVERRSGEIADALKECYAKLFLDGDFTEPSFLEEVAL